MMKMLVLAAALAVCAGPAVAQGDQLVSDCYEDPETTGSLPTDPRSLFMPGERPVTADAKPRDESWQAQAEETSEQRRQDLLACGVD
jgi:hypothetical protein